MNLQDTTTDITSLQAIRVDPRISLDEVETIVPNNVRSSEQHHSHLNPSHASAVPPFVPLGMLNARSILPSGQLEEVVNTGKAHARVEGHRSTNASIAFVDVTCGSVRAKIHYSHLLLPCLIRSCGILQSWTPGGVQYLPFNCEINFPRAFALLPSVLPWGRALLRIEVENGLLSAWRSFQITL